MPKYHLKTGAKRVATHLLEQECLEMRRTGMALSHIGRTLGLTACGVHKAIARALARNPVSQERADAYRQHQLEEISYLFTKAEEVLTTTEQDRSKLAAIETMIHLMERGARTMGTDAATKYAFEQGNSLATMPLPALIDHLVKLGRPFTSWPLGLQAYAQEKGLVPGNEPKQLAASVPEPLELPAVPVEGDDDAE